MNKALIKVLTLTTLLPMVTIVDADNKFYGGIELGYANADT